jgi:threonine dehydrogenase-like Zn-dependent dehydrogenase
MKGVVFQEVGAVRVDDLPEPKIEEPTDAVVRFTASAICGARDPRARGAGDIRVG